MSVLTMLFSAAAIILFVKYGLLRGIDQIADAMNWKAKMRGQVTGYATSVPEFVCLVAAGMAGVWEAGLWNIASSNIINAGLMLLAVLKYGQFREFFNRRFFDEILFATLAILVPLVLMLFGMDTQWLLVPLLLAFFVLYQVVDHKVNQSESVSEEDVQATGNLPVGLILGISSLVAIAIAGTFLGESTGVVVQKLGVHPAIAGWILGVVTSIPEMVSFFAVYAAAKEEGKLDSLDDTQEALDNLTGSNMANVGVVYPIGLLVFLLATLLVSR